MPSWNPEANELFLEALECRSIVERRAFLDQACRDRPDLRAQVEGLLAASEKAVSFLEDSPVDLMESGVSHPEVPDESSRRLNQQTPEVSSPPLSEGPGTRIGPYKLLEQIGEGGMGVVYMAEQEAPVRRLVAFKIIKPGMDSRQVIARFEAERQALALMDHQNIARVFDAGATETGRPYFVMELVHGVPITDYCDQNFLTPSERLRLFVPVCQAVQHAHQKGIIHRDIKPSNVLVTLYDGKPVAKVIDFGIAKAIEKRLTERTLFTQFGTLVGTLEYMSPEQTEMSGLGVDTRSDIYTLGVLMYELLTGTTPLGPARVREVAYAELLRMIREEEPPKPSTRIGTSGDGLASISARRRTEPVKLAKLLKGDLDWIVMKALEKDRTHRYDTASNLARDVERYLVDEPVEACPPSVRYRFRKFARKHRTGLLISAAFVGLLISGLVAFAFLMVRAMAAEQHAIEEAEKAGQERDRAVQAEKHAEEESALVLAMNNFLRHELLEQADPAVHANIDLKPDKDIKLRTVLDRAAGRIAGAFPEKPELEAAIRRSIGEAYRALGEYDLARLHLEAAYQVFRKFLGDSHPDTLTTQQNLANLFRDLGEFDRAEPLLQDTLEARQRNLGADHPDTLSVQYNLADLYWSWRKHAKAEPLFRATLEARQRNLGADHPDTLATQTGLANVYLLLGQHSKAKPLYLQSLNASRRVLGPDHPETLTVQNNLAQLYRALGQHAEAKPLLVETLDLRRKKLGPDHPHTLTSQNNLGTFYKDQGRYTEAQLLLEQTLDARRKKLGLDHPETLASRNNLAKLYTELGQFDKAEPLYLKNLEVFLRERGPVFPETISTQHNLAQLYRGQGRLQEAERLFLSTVEARRRTQGPDHPETLNTEVALSNVYWDRQDYGRAGELLGRTLEASRAKLGSENPITLAAQHCLANVYCAQGRYTDAETLFLATVAGRRKLHGPDHLETLNAQHCLANVYRSRAEYDKAEPLYLRAVEGRRKTLGANHRNTLDSQTCLAEIYQARGQYARAERLLEEVLASGRRALGDGHPQVAGTLAAQGLNLLRQQKYAEAETPLRESLKIRLGKLPDEWTAFSTKSLLGASLLGQKKYAEAEPLLLAGYEGMKNRIDRIPVQSKVHLTHAVERIVDLYTAWGKTDKAEEWRKKAK